MHRLSAATLATALLVIAAPSARAQAVSGMGEDATTVGAGRLRLWVGADWSLAQEAYVPDGQGGHVLQPLGAPLSVDALGAAQIGALAPLQDSLRLATGSSALQLSLGQSKAQVNQTVTHVPITLEAGLARWLSVSATVPIVHTISDVFFAANVGGAGANLGANPARTNAQSLASDTAFVQQLARSAAAVASYCGGPGAGSSACSGSTALVASASAFAGEISSVYASGGLAPLQSSAIQGQVDARSASVRDALNAFAAIPGSGVPTVSATGVVGATSPVTTADVQAFLSDPSLSTAIVPLQTIERWHLGDAELNAKVTLFDSFALRGASRFTPHGVNVRVAVSGGYRFPTGSRGSPDVILDVPQEEHTSALLAGGYVDVLLGRHLWSSFVAHYARPRASDVVVRASAPGVVIPQLADRVTLSRQLGDVLELDATPQWVVNDFFSIGGVYSYVRRGGDAYQATSAAPPPDLLMSIAGPDYGVLGTGTEVREHRVGGGIVFSNAHAVALGRSRVPFDVSYQHLETIRVTGGTAPKYTTDRILVRLYYGHDRERP